MTALVITFVAGALTGTVLTWWRMEKELDRAFREGFGKGLYAPREPGAVIPIPRRGEP